MIPWWEHSQKGVTDRQTDGKTDWTVHRAAWSQLKTIGHLSYASSSFMHHFLVISEFKFVLESGKAQIRSILEIFCLLWPWNLRWPSTRQIWGIWKLRLAYSPETPNLGQNRWCFVPCDLEIWWMTLENNRASPLCCFKSNSTIFRAVWPWNLTDDLEKQ